MRKLADVAWIAICFLVIATSLASSEETITITTYYPSPAGSYRELQANRMLVAATGSTRMPTSDGVLAWGNGRGLLTNDQGASIELGGNGTPYIDFSNDTTATNDFDARIALFSNDVLYIRGTRNAANVLNGGLLVDGLVLVRASDATPCINPPCGCLVLTYGTSTGTVQCPAGTRLRFNTAAPSANGGIMYCCKL